jgi:hypothetical protein
LCEACIVETFDLSYASSGLCEACSVETIYYLHASLQVCIDTAVVLSMFMRVCGRFE